jgi:hypothetical protein
MQAGLFNTKVRNEMNIRTVSKVAFGLMVVALLCGSAPAGPDAWIGPAPSGSAYPDGEADRRFAALSKDIKLRSKIKSLESQVFRKDAMILDTDRDPLDIVLRRSEALLADIAAGGKAPNLAKMRTELAALKASATKIEPKDAPARRAIFDKVCAVRRKIAFSNPLLDFNELMILKRVLPSYSHMCDQYYGLAQRPGGGLYILSDPFGAKPAIRSILDKSVVANGRLKGQELSGGPNKVWKVRYNGNGGASGDATEGGSFLSPDLSFDGKNISFAYVELTGEQTHDFHTDPSKGHWKKGRSYHVFSVGTDGKNLRMLTDGTWNDFDPCFMPSGRIAFITERRGGYLRCGRVCPTYTLYDMAPDGSGIKCLSFHETNEWHPSVNNDGMIVWTRWDYVDRHGVTAHMPWVTTPDGRDPRAIHGNYSVRAKRPDMEVDVRAIPGSHKYVAIAAGHHRHALGSMVIVDPRAEDDDAMGPVKRMTPEIGFPETQGGTAAYGQPWPLSENYYICAYEATAGGRPGNSMYGIYLVDTFGNKELIYRDPAIASQNPIPVKARTKPPVIPEMSDRLSAKPSTHATIGVVNVYNTRTPLPKGSKIKSLRVFQVFPLSVASARVTHATGWQVPQATDSINLTRAVLGTVPVEADGSAHLTVPAGKELFFQILDENGLAITSMRSGTHFQPGERTVCQGCHEPKYGVATSPSRKVTMAMKRAPSVLKPEADGTNPFNYPRLIQPVLDKHCVKCHEKNKDNKDLKVRPPSLSSDVARTKRASYMNPRSEYFTSYISLAPKYGFYDYGGKNWSDPKWYRTTPGEFGAKASKLYQMLSKGHNKVKLSPEEMRRITVWLDACSPFYGVYEKEGGQAQLRGEIAKPTLE